MSQIKRKRVNTLKVFINSVKYLYHIYSIFYVQYIKYILHIKYIHRKRISRRS